MLHHPSVLLLVLWPLAMAVASRMEVLYSWKQVDFTYLDDLAREYALRSAQFIPKHNLVLDVDVWGGGSRRKVFVTLPKFKPGIPATLATVTDQRHNGTTLLRPYPDWSWHEGADCLGITSVFRTRVDQCGRLWVLDSGTVDIFTQPRRICPPQLLVFDPKTDKLLKRFRFPDTLLDEDSLLISVVVDTRLTDCSDAVAYVADVNNYKLLVYDSAADTTWLVANNLFYPWPLYGDFHINGKNFDLMDGLFGLALGPVRNGDRILYFHALASVRLGWVSTAVVRNYSLFAEDQGAAARSFHIFHDSRPSQTAAQDMTDSGVLLYALLEENAIGCWNTHQVFHRQYMDIAAKDDTTLQFQSGLKVYGGLVWSLSSRLQNYILDEVPEDEVNYRVNVGRVPGLLSQTRCQQQHFLESLAFPQL